jgi:hypothetical protein
MLDICKNSQVFNYQYQYCQLTTLAVPLSQTETRTVQLELSWYCLVVAFGSLKCQPQRPFSAAYIHSTLDTDAIFPRRPQL